MQISFSKKYLIISLSVIIGLIVLSSLTPLVAQKNIESFELTDTETFSKNQSNIDNKSQRTENKSNETREVKANKTVRSNINGSNLSQIQSKSEKFSKNESNSSKDYNNTEENNSNSEEYFLLVGLILAAFTISFYIYIKINQVRNKDNKDMHEGVGSDSFDVIWTNLKEKLGLEREVSLTPIEIGDKARELYSEEVVNEIVEYFWLENYSDQDPEFKNSWKNKIEDGK